MTSRLRKNAVTLAPDAALEYLRDLRAWRSGRQQQRSHSALMKVMARGGTVVQGGPFRGMTYVAGDSSWNPPTPYLLGSYERELHPILAELIRDRPTRVIDVGAADGYYAIGLARLLGETAIHAFEVNPIAREACWKLAQLNGVTDRVTVHGECTHVELSKFAGPGTWLIVDCEGCEESLLDPSSCPLLRATSIIVELHEFLRPGVTTRLLSRFVDSHDYEVISAKAPSLRDWPVPPSLTRSENRAARDERRPTKPTPMQWAILRPIAVTVDSEGRS